MLSSNFRIHVLLLMLLESGPKYFGLNSMRSCALTQGCVFSCAPPMKQQQHHQLPSSSPFMCPMYIRYASTPCVLRSIKTKEHKKKQAIINKNRSILPQHHRYTNNQMQQTSNIAKIRFGDENKRHFGAL